MYSSFEDKFENELHDIMHFGVFILNCQHVNKVLKPKPAAAKDKLRSVIPVTLRNLYVKNTEFMSRCFDTINKPVITIEN